MNLRQAPPPRHSALVAATVLAALVATSACTNADLYGVDITKSVPNKIALFGQVCTDSPIQRDLPVKVVLVLDGSNISAGNAAVGGRIYAARSQAAQNAIDRYPLSRNYSHAMVRFAGATDSYTNDRFSTDVAELQAGVMAYGTPCTGDGVECNSRNYDLGFSRAASIITGDLLRSTAGEAARTTYAIIFYADGPHLEPDCSPASNCPTNACPASRNCRVYTGQCCGLSPLSACPAACQDTVGTCDEGCYFERRIRALRDYVLTNGGAGMILHAAHFQEVPLSEPPQCAPPANTDDPEQCRAFWTLERMAAAGGGAYTPTTIPEGLNLTSFDLRSTKNVFIKKSLLAVNLNARPVGNVLKVDSDVDGLPDDEEVLGGCPNPYFRDSDGDGLGDGFEKQLTSQGLDPCVPDTIPSCEGIAPEQDSDADGLHDCEEKLLRLEPTLFDTDADGYPDLVEFLYGTNYLVDDVARDDDYDGINNGQELSVHTDPRSNDARIRAESSYLYRETNLGVQPILIVQQPRRITGVVVESISPRVASGPSVLFYHPGPPPYLAWQDALDPNNFGPPVSIGSDGTYTLHSGTSVAGDEELERSVQVRVIFGLLPPNSLTETLQIRETEHQCTDFRIRNITLVHTRPGQPGEGQNEILTFFSEVPTLSPDSPGIFRVARSVVTYIPPDFKDPDVADIKLSDYSFVLFE
ncbi:MAG: hypothetical protein ABIJ09_15305 [Pseudomonadota bacterium]